MLMKFQLLHSKKNGFKTIVTYFEDQEHWSYFPMTFCLTNRLNGCIKKCLIDVFAKYIQRFSVQMIKSKNS